MSYQCAVIIFFINDNTDCKTIIYSFTRDFASETVCFISFILCCFVFYMLIADIFIIHIYIQYDNG